LTIDEDEAETVRHIFSRYLEIGSVHELKRELDRDGIWSRAYRKKGLPAPFSRGALYHLLSNRIYVSEIVHKGENYPGQHEPIIGPELFDSVQQQLATNGAKRTEQTIAAGRAPLAGLLFDAEGRRLSPVSSRKSNGRVYRYYVSADLQRGSAGKDGSGTRVAAGSIEELVLNCVEGTCAVQGWQAARAHLTRVEIGPDQLRVTVRSDPRMKLHKLDPSISAVTTDSGEMAIRIACAHRRWRGRSKVVAPIGWRSERKPQIDQPLVRALIRAHGVVRKCLAHPDNTVEAVAASEGTTPAYIRRLIRLAYLAPDVQHAVLQGRLPAQVSLERLMRGRVPLRWSRQREELGL
jgi:hypothetical protein